MTDEHKACPPCCKKVMDHERIEWLIKKQFLTKMYSRDIYLQLNRYLQILWDKKNLTTKFNALDISMSDIITEAEEAEET